MANEIERTLPEQDRARDVSVAGRLEVNTLAEKIIEFYKVFDSWHCGLNQLKTFKKLSFQLTVAPQSKIKQALDLVSTQVHSSRLHTAGSPRDQWRDNWMLNND